MARASRWPSPRRASARSWSPRAASALSRSAMPPAPGSGTVPSAPLDTRRAKAAGTSTGGGSPASAAARTCWLPTAPLLPAAVAAATAPYEAAPSALRRLVRRVEACEALRQQAGDMHLADAELLGDLGLGQIVLEAQLQDQLLAPRELREIGGEQHAAFGVPELLVLAPEMATQGVVVLPRRIEGGGAVRLSRLQRLEHVLFRCAGHLGELLDCGGASEALRQVADRLTEVQVELLDATGGPHGPAAVAEVALQLADDRRRGVARELHPTLGVEPVHRLDEGERAHLVEVVEGFATVGEVARQPVGQPEVRLDQLVAKGRFASVRELRELLPELGRPCAFVRRHVTATLRSLRSQALCPEPLASEPWSSTSASRIRSESSDASVKPGAVAGLPLAVSAVPTSAAGCTVPRTTIAEPSRL